MAECLSEVCTSASRLGGARVVERVVVVVCVCACVCVYVVTMLLCLRRCLSVARGIQEI